MLMQTMEERPANTKIDRSEFQVGLNELRREQRNMLFDFFSLAGLFLAYAGFQLS